MTRLGMIFAKEVEVLSVDFSPEHYGVVDKNSWMLEFFGGCIYIYITHVIPIPPLLPRSVFQISIGRHVRFRSKTQQDSMAL